MGISGWHQLQYLWRKRGATLSAPPVAPHGRGGALWGGLIPISRRIISAEARPTAARLPPCGDKRVGGALFNYGGIGRGPAVGVADQGGPGLDLLPTFNNISAQPSSPLQPHPHRKRAKIGTLFSTAAGCSALHSTLSDRCNRLGACLGFPSSASAPTAPDHVPRAASCPLERGHGATEAGGLLGISDSVSTQVAVGAYPHASTCKHSSSYLYYLTRRSSCGPGEEGQVIKLTSGQSKQSKQSGQSRQSRQSKLSKLSKLSKVS